ncbi:MAG TPA: CPBP family intramembrane glutamic endopeptidase [Candidatus Norongarragalinales archaeon]|jgi:hypothetical protein|nr:CPBP family intramembrane glutamic endopeptidase [Candidatus Norongarragalinales archaeon]
MELVLVLAAVYALFSFSPVIQDKEYLQKIFRSSFSQSALLVTIVCALGYYFARGFIHASFNTSWLPSEYLLFAAFFALEEFFFRGFLVQKIGPLPSAVAFVATAALVYEANPPGILALIFLAALSTFLARRFGIAYSIVFRAIIPALGLLSLLAPSMALELLVLLLPFAIIKLQKPGWRLSTVLRDLEWPRIKTLPLAMVEVFEGIKLFFTILVLVIILGFIMRALGVLDTQNVADVIEKQSVLALFFAITLAPLAEEIFFRGFLQKRAGLVLTSALFALLHYGYGSVSEIVAAFGASLILGDHVRRRALKGQKGLVAVIIAHALYNLFAIVMIANAL